MFKCITCGNNFSYHKNFEKHLINNKCKKKYIYIIPKIYIKSPDEINEIFNHKFNEIYTNNLKLKYGCEICGKLYSAKNYLYHHRKTVCEKETLVNVKLEEMEPHLNSTTQQQDNINKMLSSNSNHNSHNNNSNSYNTTGRDMNVINNNNINNIIIQNYNNEYDDDIIKSIPDNLKLKILQKPNTAIMDLYKLIHIDTPQFRNVLIKHPKDGYGLIMKNGDWIPIKMTELLTDLVIKNSDILYDIANDDAIKIKKSYLKKITNLLEEVTDNTSITSDIKQDIKLLTYQFREIIEDTYNKSINKKKKLALKLKK